MRRRDFTALVVGSTMMRPLRVYAQQSQKMARIGILLPGAPATWSLRTNAFLDGLRELGYVEGKTIAIEWKWGTTNSIRCPDSLLSLYAATLMSSLRVGLGCSGSQSHNSHNSDC